MLLGGRVLLIEDSRFMLEALGRLLLPHFTKIATANSYASALQHLEEDPRIDVIVSDVVLPDGNGFKLLEKINTFPAPRPKVLLISARWTEADRDRAASLGAIGYLPKPISVRDLRRVLARDAAPVARAARLRTLSRVWIVDPERRERLLCFDVHDISETGMLLDTTGPLPVGTEIEFEIVRGEGEAIRGRGSIVRVQEPTWLNVGGAALHFAWVESQAKLKKLIEQEAALALAADTKQTGGSSPPNA